MAKLLDCIDSVCKNRMVPFCLFLMMASASPSPSQPRQPMQDPGAGQYNLPYELPSPDSIKGVIDRVYRYFDSDNPFRIVDRKTGDPIENRTLLNPQADLGMVGNDQIALWAYTMGVTYMGMLKASEATDNPTYRTYPIKCMKFYCDWLPYFQKLDSAFGDLRNGFRPVVRTSSLDDCGAMGAALIKIYKIEKDPRLLAIINHIADYISHRQFRLADGTLARQRPQAQSVWADDAFMCVPFLAQMGDLTKDKTYLDDAVKQILQMSRYLFKKDKKLFDHGLNVHNAYDPNFFWGRANGWVMMAIAELLDVLPEKYKGRDEILSILRTHVQGVTEVQGGDGLWHNLLDKTDSYLETSCSAMFVYTIAHAINKGWIDYTFGPVAQAGWNALATRVGRDGRVEGTCWGTTFASDNVYYYHRPAEARASHGYGPVLFAAAEMLKLLSNDKIFIQEGYRTYHYRLKSDIKK
ncbi:MAG TPA: glycoside hydrolase family 88 protein [bacterium]